MFEEKGYGFLKFQTHLAATQAICEMTGQMINGCQVSKMAADHLQIHLFSSNVDGERMTTKPLTLLVESKILS